MNKGGVTVKVLDGTTLVRIFLGRFMYNVLRKSDMFSEHYRDKADRYCKFYIKEGMYEETGMRYRRQRW